MCTVQQVYLALAPEMKLLIRFLLLLGLSQVSERSVFAHAQPLRAPESIPPVKGLSQPALQLHHHTDHAATLKAQKKATRKNCRKLAIIDDEDDETVSLKKHKSGKPASFLPAGHLIATAFYQLSSGLPGLPDDKTQLPGQDRVSDAGYRLYVLFRVFRI